MNQEEQWDQVIEPKRHVFDLKLHEIWKYRDLLRMFVKRDIVVVYKQTVLGPLWFIIQPILTSLIQLLVFGKIANISTDGLPGILFYLSGNTIWLYFADTFNQTANTFKQNANIFGKVYFPRLIMPLSKVSSELIKFGIRFAFFLAIYGYIVFIVGNDVPKLTESIVLLPLLVLMMAGFGLGFGIIFTSLTAKYRDVTFLISFGVQLLMYATPVIYPSSTIPEEYKVFIAANPLTHIVEAFRYAMLGAGTFSPEGLMYSGGVMIVTLIAGVVIFNKTEQNFMDTV